VNWTGKRLNGSVNTVCQSSLAVEVVTRIPSPNGRSCLRTVTIGFGTICGSHLQTKRQFLYVRRCARLLLAAPDYSF